MKTEYEGLTCETVSDAAGRRAEASLVPTFEGRELDAKDLPEIQSEIRFIGDMQRLQVKPGDIFVLNVADEITDETAERLRKHLLRVLGDEAKVLVLDQRLTLRVMGMSYEPMTIPAKDAQLIEKRASPPWAWSGVAPLIDLLQSK